VAVQRCYESIWGKKEHQTELRPTTSQSELLQAIDADAESLEVALEEIFYNLQSSSESEEKNKRRTNEAKNYCQSSQWAAPQRNSDKP